MPIVVKKMSVTFFV